MANKLFKDKNEEIFETFIIKEREQREVEKIHAQMTIKYMSDCYQKHITNATMFTKIKDFFYDIIDYHNLKKIKLQNIKRIKDVLEEDKCNKDLKEKTFERKPFKIHIHLDQNYQANRTTIADCGGISYPYIDYSVYMQIEYEDILTDKNYSKDFDDLNDAINYYETLVKTIKDKKVEKIINDLTVEIDDHCEELKSRINFFDKMLCQ